MPRHALPAPAIHLTVDLDDAAVALVRIRELAGRPYDGSPERLRRRLELVRQLADVVLRTSLEAEEDA